MTKARKRTAILVLTLALTWGMALVAQASSTAVLSASETEKSTGAVANTNGGFTWWGRVESISDYNVEFIMYGGSNSNNCNLLITSRAVNPGGSFDPEWVEATAATYNVGKVTMYGNTKSNPKKGCIAGAGISSTN